LSALAELRPDDIRAVSADVWSAYLEGHAAEDCPDPTCPETLTPLAAPVAPSAEVVRAAVDILGPCRGVVVLELEPATAHAAAVRMLGDEPAELTDVDDAVGELVNMVGGNLKSLLPQSCSLGLPVVVRGGGSAPEARELCRVDFAWQGHPLRVMVWGHPAPVPPEPKEARP
jgi:chemotaxis protein CheX